MKHKDETTDKKECEMTDKQDVNKEDETELNKQKKNKNGVNEITEVEVDAEDKVGNETDGDRMNMNESEVENKCDTDTDKKLGTADGEEKKGKILRKK